MSNQQTRVALVTGSGRRRIGSHVADALAGRGYRIAVHYHTSRTGAEETVARLGALGAHAEAFQADLTDEAAIERLVQSVVASFGRIDLLVNAAAIWRPRPIEQVTARDVRDHFEANVLATFLISRLAGLIMVGQNSGGSIVTFGDWAQERPYVNYSAYFASKGAIPALTRCLAVELGTRNPNVRVNAILPGPVMLPPGLSPHERDEAIQGTLVKREGSPEHIARAVLYLIDNDFVTGSCLTVDGGRSVYAPGPASS